VIVSTKKMLKTIVNHVKYKQRFVNTNIKVVMKNSIHTVGQKPKTILAGEGPPPPERGTGDADALLKSAAPKISNSKLKVIVFDMSVLVLHNPNDSSPTGIGFTSVGNWESWNIKQGTKGLLGYLHTRGIQAALLPRLDIRNDANLVDKAVHALSDQMQYEFSHVAANDPPNLDKSKSKLVQNLEVLRKHSFNSVDCNDMMIFSIDPDILQEAKDANYLTCAFKLGGVNWKAARVASNHVNSMDEMKLIVEDYNGISFRNRSTFF
jgi:hypothetical protein